MRWATSGQPLAELVLDKQALCAAERPIRVRVRVALGRIISEIVHHLSFPPIRRPLALPAAAMLETCAVPLAGIPRAHL